jgi:hypothetical protein
MFAKVKEKGGELYGPDFKEENIGVITEERNLKQILGSVNTQNDLWKENEAYYIWENGKKIIPRNSNLKFIPWKLFKQTRMEKLCHEELMIKENEPVELIKEALKNLKLPINKIRIVETETPSKETITFDEENKPIKENTYEIS